MTLAIPAAALVRASSGGLLVALRLFAPDLGIPPRRAHELQDQVERELGITRGVA